MPALKRNIGDWVLAEGRLGRIAGYWEYDPEHAPFPYRVDLVGSEAGQLYAEHELTDYPASDSTDVWEAMAFAYWSKWTKAEDELENLREMIRELIEHGFA